MERREKADECDRGNKFPDEIQDPSSGRKYKQEREKIKARPYIFEIKQEFDRHDIFLSPISINREINGVRNNYCLIDSEE